MSDKTLVNTILHGDAFTVLQTLPSNFIQTCITSPPYYGLRNYNTETILQLGDDPQDCQHDWTKEGRNEYGAKVAQCKLCSAVKVDQQIGLEETPEAYVEKLVAVFREVRRVLRDDGVLWVNLGDTYSDGTMGRKDAYQTIANRAMSKKMQVHPIKDRVTAGGLGSKQLLMIPARVALALQADGWILRSDVIWHKPTAMPESVTDRPTTAHEHIFLLAKSERYFYDADAIREPLRPKTFTTYGTRNLIGKGNDLLGGVKSDNWNRTVPEKKPKLAADGEIAGANKRTVWTVANHPFAEAHFATFPPKLIEPCILAGTSPQACEQCGAPWERVTARVPMVIRNGPKAGGYGSRTTDGLSGTMLEPARAVTTGWQPTCTCTNEGTGTCIVLDPFMGAGTTALVALLHHRDYLGIELNQEYITMTKKRIATVPQVLWTGESEAVS